MAHGKLSLTANAPLRKQRKTDRIDAKKMVRALLAHDRGDSAVLSRVRVPSAEEEDRKRLLQDRRCLVKKRTSLTISIKGLLKLHGVFDLQPRAKRFESKFAEVRTAYGSPFPPRARRGILRLAERCAHSKRDRGTDSDTVAGTAWIKVGYAHRRATDAKACQPGKISPIASNPNEARDAVDRTKVLVDLFCFIEIWRCR